MFNIVLFHLPSAVCGRTFGILKMTIMISKYTILLFLLSLGLSLSAQHYVDSTQTYLKNGSNIHAEPGDTVYFNGGDWPYIMLENFQGKKDSLITFINNNGQVRIHNTHYFGFNVKNCDYIKIAGNGDTNHLYGIHISQVTQGGGFGFGSLSNHFELSYTEIEHTLLAGIYAKTDPDNTFKSSRDSFLMEDIYIHHNFIHDVGDEGMYLGSTKYFGQPIPYNGGDTTVLPHLLQNVEVAYNTFHDIGWDAIQLSSAALGKNSIHDNYILRDSERMSFNQMSGIMVGGGTRADVYNNYIQDGKGSGMVIASLGGQRIYNNVIINAGQGFYPQDPMQMQHGIYVGDISMATDSSLFIFNNTIIHPKSDCIRFTSLKSTDNKIANNVLVDPGNYEFYDSLHTSFTKDDAYIMISDPNIQVDTFANRYSQWVNQLGFLNPSKNKFALSAQSTLIDQGSSNPLVSISFDHYNKPRPIGQGIDIGAFEFDSTHTNIPVPRNEKASFYIFPNPVRQKLYAVIPYTCDSTPSVEIISLKGEKQKATFTFDRVSSKVTMNTQQLISGVYIVHIITRNHSHSAKFIVIHDG